MALYLYGDSYYDVVVLVELLEVQVIDLFVHWAELSLLEDGLRYGAVDVEIYSIDSRSVEELAEVLNLYAERLCTLLRDEVAGDKSLGAELLGSLLACFGTLGACDLILFHCFV